MLVGDLEAPLAEGRVDGVRYTLPVLRLVHPRVYRAGSPLMSWGPDTPPLANLEDFLDGRALD
jgi:hypothetical protein